MCRTWSAVFHCRDTRLTERLDYCSAAALVVGGAAVAATRALGGSGGWGGGWGSGQGKAAAGKQRQQAPRADALAALVGVWGVAAWALGSHLR